MIKRKKLINMDEIMHMSSKTNSLEGIKEKFKKGVIENRRNVAEKRKEIIQRRGYSRMPLEERLKALAIEFDAIQYRECSDNSMGSNPRWGIVSKKNLYVTILSMHNIFIIADNTFRRNFRQHYYFL